MIAEYYKMIFKRKSFRRYDNSFSITEEELNDINEKIKKLDSLMPNINIDCKIVPRNETTSKRGEYCLLIYSEKKKHFLLNVGYMFEQLDLYLASKNIGVCWYGMGKVQEQEYNDKKYVIMMTLGKAEPDQFRKNYTKCKRKDTNESWIGNSKADVISEVIKYAPSACNSQPWKVYCKNNILKIYRTQNIKSIIPKNKIAFYNSIDMGIFLYFVELTLLHNNISFNRSLTSENDKPDLIHIATYELL